MTRKRREFGFGRVADLIKSLLGCFNARSAALPQNEFAFEGKVIVVKDVASTPEGARCMIVTFRVVRAVSGPMPKYVIVETRMPPAPDLEPGMLCLVRATAAAGDPAETLAPAIVCGLRDAQISVSAVVEGAAA